MARALLLMTILLTLTSATSSSPAVGTTETIGTVSGVTIEVKVQGPSAQDTPLQIICIFEYIEGDIYTSPPALSKELNGLVHVDSALNGLLTDIRKTKKFSGTFLETLLIKSPSSSLTPKYLLLIGLGSKSSFTPEMMQLVGTVSMREALRLNVTSYSHASDLKDAGYSSPTALVTGYVIQGALAGYQTQSYLKTLNASDPLTVTKITLLAGPAYFEDSKEGIQKAISSLNTNQ